MNANLLVDIASDKVLHTTNTLLSSGQNLLLEFFSDELTASGDACIGGFLAHAAVLGKNNFNNYIFYNIWLLEKNFAIIS